MRGNFRGLSGKASLSKVVFAFVPTKALPAGASQPHDVVMAEGFELTQLQQLETAQLKLLEFQFN